MTGTIAGRFAIGQRLGAGGMGEVYRADDLRLKRPVAIKRLAPGLADDPAYRQRFLKEVERASALNHPHIASVYDVLELGDELYLVMEYIEGVTLRERLKQPMDLGEFLAIGIQCADGLRAAHAKGIIHGDVKPENIMLTPAHQVKVLDFGVAKRLPTADVGPETASLGTLDASISGTPAYMSPEVLLGKPSNERADIFALGVVFYEALAGRNPFRSETLIGTTDRILRETPPPLSGVNAGVPVAVEHVINRMMAKDPAERHASAQEVVDELRRLARELDAGKLAPGRAGLSARHRYAIGAGLAVLIAAIVLVGRGVMHTGLLNRSGRTTPAPPAPQQLAVLPFAPVGGDAKLQAFADGLTDTLTGKLTQLTARPSLEVFPASEVRAHDVKTVEDAQKQFGVNSVLTGSLQTSGDQVRVTAVLIDAKTRRQVKSATITASLADAFAVEDQVVASAVQMLGIHPGAHEREVLEAHGTEQTGAYDDYLEGRGYTQQFEKPEKIQSAIEAFNRALEKDPNYGLAYAGLGQAYWYRYEQTHAPAWVEHSRAACAKAANLGNGGAAAHVCLGLLDNGTGRYAMAAAEFRALLQLEPTADEGYTGLARAYEKMGKLDEAEKTYRQAIALRPNYGAAYNWLGRFYFNQGRYDEAARMFGAMVNLSPDAYLGYGNLGGAYLMEGQYTEAIEPLKTSIEIRPTYSSYSNLGTAYYDLHRFNEAARTYEEAVRLDPDAYDTWGNLGDAYYWAPDERGRAVAAYQKAIVLGEQALKINPADSLLASYIATYQAMLNQRREALVTLQRALTPPPKDPELMFNAALVYNRFGDTGPALDWLAKAVAAGYAVKNLRNTPNFSNLQGDRRFEKLFEKDNSRRG
ncbi:MAG TPA: protein kinase [Terriglobia bacterium]|nr:protein kinase [Terriglobia bacterium]